MKCADIPLPELVRGDLPEDTASLVRAHLASCSRCRERARIMAVLEVSETARVTSTRRRVRPLAVAASVILAGILILLLRHLEVGQTSPNLAASWATDEAYPYVGLTVRSSENGSDQERSQAFSAYQHGEYAAAARDLMRLESDPEVTFYLGVSLYLSGETEAASHYLSEAAQTEGWQEPARWYLANALLRDGQVSAARQTLTELTGEHGEFQRQAGELLQKLATVSDRSP